MPSGPYFDKRRGTYNIQWHDGRKWRRVNVGRARNWKAGDPRPRKDPPEALAALAAYAEKEKAARRNRPIDPGLTVDEFLGRYQGAYARDRAAGSVDQLGQAVRRFVAWCEAARLPLVELITPSACQRFLDARAGDISRKTKALISPRRLAQERALLSGAWRRAVRSRELADNPWSSVVVPGGDRAKRAKVARPSWSPEEFARLSAAARPWLRDVLTVGINTGLRITALLSLEWRDVRWSKPNESGLGYIEVRPELDKAGRGHRVPLSSACHDALARRLVHKEGDRVLTGQAGRPTTPNLTRKAILLACKRAGLVEPSSPNHHMRRSFGRWAVLGHLTGRPIPIFVVSKWMGHATVKMTEEYLDLRIDESADWMTDHSGVRLEEGPGEP